jgi:osmoprotectant transport system substrate-binding protein
MARAVFLVLLSLVTWSCAEVTDDAVEVGTFAIAEAELLAGVVAAAGGDGNWGFATFETRSELLAALDAGEVDVAIDYLGSLLDHLGVPGEAQGDAPGALLAQLRPDDVVIVAPGHAGRGLVVTSDFAGRRGLRSISGLFEEAGQMVVGGPTDCPRSSTCLAGLATVYGFAFGGFVPIDDPELLAASLEAGEVDAAVLFVTDPALDRRRLVALDDDLDMHVLEAPVAIVRGGALTDDAIRAIGDTLARLDTEAILGLNLQAEAVGPERAIERFVGG